MIWQGRPSWRAYAGATIVGWLLAVVVVGLVILVVLEVKKRSISWMVSSRRLELERGFLSRRIDTVELWRVKDVEYRQSIWERMVGASTIVVTARDEVDPVVLLRGLPGDRGVFDQLSNAVLQARQQRGVMNLTE